MSRFFSFPQQLVVFCIFFIVIFSSCTVSRYQVVHLDSNLPKDQNNEFVFENDSLKVAYSFAGEGGPFQMIIFNDSDNPLYVNWDKSALIVNGMSRSINSFQTGIVVNDFGLEIPPTTKSDAIELIAPKAFVRREIYFHEGTFLDTHGYNFEVGKRNDPVKGRNVDITHYPMKAEETVLKVRNYLLLSQDEGFSNQTAVDAEFWASSVYDTDSEFLVKNLSVEMDTQGKTTVSPKSFYFAEHKVVGNGAATLLLLIGIITLAIAVGD